jgi:hypothetical protein
MPPQPQNLPRAPVSMVSRPQTPMQMTGMFPMPQQTISAPEMAAFPDPPPVPVRAKSTFTCSEQIFFKTLFSRKFQRIFLR